MPVINISVRNKIAKQTDRTVYVCGNSDYTIKFNFDPEWDAYSIKTARISFNGHPLDVAFEGNECIIPVITGTYRFDVGVFAGDLHTTTAARVSCKKSALCADGYPVPPPPDIYNQIMDKLNHMGGGTPDVDEVDALTALMETATIDPAADDNGAVYTDDFGNIYSL